MVGMVVVGAVGDDDVGIPLTDQAREGPAILERGHDLTVVNVEDFVGNAESLGDGLHFLQATHGQRTAGHLPVADIAVGGGNQLHVMA